MNRTIHLLSCVIALAMAGAAGASVIVTDQWRNEFAINAGGTLVIDNSVGNIDVVAGNGTKILVTSDRTIRAADNSLVAEARLQTQQAVGGDEKVRILRTVVPPGRNARWTSSVSYVVKVPYNINVKIGSVISERIRVAGVRGGVSIKNMNGSIALENVAGPVIVDSINGNILYVASGPLPANTRLSTVNGDIDVRPAVQSNFVWETESITGDAKTAFGVHGGRFLSPTRFRGNVNVPASITLITETFGGNVLLMPPGADIQAARSVRSMAVARITRVVPRPGSGSTGQQVVTPKMPSEGLRRPRVEASFEYTTSIGDIAIGEIHGDAQITTGAGQIQLGTVTGQCVVKSYGGPLTLGEITGELTARTEAGDIVVQAARRGGTISTGGGTIRLHYTGGATRLMSGGGDIVVRQAAGPITADTRSGDITIMLDPAQKSEKVFARTQKGNIVLNIPPGLGADVEAIVISSDPNANLIRTDLAGLSIQRDQVNGKTRLHATGKINGGGERIELYAEDGGILISSDSARVSPVVPAP